jgi:magnesium and cobalt exporter, CNNM family
MDSVSLEFMLIALGILANGVFAGSEFALVSSRISRLAELRQRSVRGAAAAMQLKETPETFLATIQIAITAVGTLTSAVGGATAVDALSPWLMRVGLGAGAETVALGIIILVITYASLVVGELTPKAIALRNPERLACLMAPVVAAISRVLAPIVRVLSASTNLVLRILGMGTAQESPFVSEDDVKYLVREGARKGVFEKVEEELVHNVFEFADTTVREIMTPRPQIKGLDLGTPPETVLGRAMEVGHSRIPVYQGSVEAVVGVVTLKDLLGAVARGETPRLPALLRPAVFVPETVRISRLLRQIQQTRQGLAMVVDEYGSVVGLVTIEDVVEEIVGEIRDEGDHPAEFITNLADGSVVVDGVTPIDEVERHLGITLPKPRDFSTVAGLLLDALNSVPTPGTSVVVAGRRWTVLEMDSARIRRVGVQPE